MWSGGSSESVDIFGGMSDWPLSSVVSLCGRGWNDKLHLVRLLREGRH